MNGLNLFRYIISLFYPRTLIGLKVRLFSSVIAALVFDIGFQFIFNYNGIFVKVDGPNPLSIISCLLTLIILVIIDWILYIRQQNMVFRLMQIIMFIDIPSNFRTRIINAIFEEIHRRY